MKLPTTMHPSFGMRKAAITIALMAGLLFCQGAPAADAARFEAESMSYGSFASTVTHADASGSKALKYDSDGTATKQLTTTSTTDAVVIRARRGSNSTERVYIRLLIDGVAQGPAKQLTSDTYGDHRFAVSVAPGTHKIGVQGVDLSGKDYLYVDVLTLSAGPDASPPPAQCSDALDNDADGLTDYPADPGCSGTSDTDEADPTSAPPEGVLWRADAERPPADEWVSASMQGFCTTNLYPGVVLPRISQVSSSAAPVLSGTKSYRIEVRDGDNCYGERAEIGTGNPPRTDRDYQLFHEGEERWIGFAIHPGPGFQADPASWWVSMQLKQLGGYGSPVIELDPDRGIWEHHRKTNDPNNQAPAGFQTSFDLGPINMDGWNKFIYHVKFSPDPKVGFTEIYGDLGDGKGMRLLLPKMMNATMKINPDTGKTINSHARIGNYRDPNISGTAVAYYDSYTVATTRAGAESGF